MIDADQLERDILDEPGDTVTLPKDAMQVVIAELRAGRAAQRSLARMAGHASVAIATAGVRVSSGYIRESVGG